MSRFTGVDYRHELLRYVVGGRLPFSKVESVYTDAAVYYATMAANVRAELVAAVEQAGRAAAATLTCDGLDASWALSPDAKAMETFKGCIVKDVSSGEAFWIVRSDQLGGGKFSLQGFDVSGNISALDKSVKYKGRSLKVLVFAADYACRYAAACEGARGADADLVAMVLDPADARPATYSPAAAADAQLNEPQLKAVLGLQRRLEVIHGPPGTGKSTTILGLLTARVPSDRAACVTCVTNQAVEAVSLKLQAADALFLVLGSRENVGDVSKKHLLRDLVEADPDVAKAAKRILSLGKVSRLTLDRAILDHEQAKDKATKKLVFTTRIFLCTTASLYRLDAVSEFFRGPLHTVVLDEAGATPESYLPQILKTGAENLVLMGDHMQLPPLVITLDVHEISEKRVNRSLMERGLDAMPADKIHLLSEQYRMPKRISDLVSKLFYQNQVVTAPSKVALDDALDASKTLRWIDSRRPEDSIGTSKVNVGEAEVVVAWLLENFQAASLNKETVKVITFYKLQRDLITQALLAHAPGEGWAAADLARMAHCVVSVDASQGSEADHVLISTVRSNDRGEIGFCADARRLCVAISRCKRTLLIVGDFSVWTSNEHWIQVLGAVDVTPPLDVDGETKKSVKAAHAALKSGSSKPCQFFLAGACSRAECPFLHDKSVPLVPLAQTLKAKTAAPCSFFAQGKCTRGGLCPYSHEPAKKEPCQFHWSGRCAKKACTFSHDFRPGDAAIGKALKKQAEGGYGASAFTAKLGNCNQGSGCPFSHDRKRISELKVAPRRGR